VIPPPAGIRNAQGRQRKRLAALLCVLTCLYLCCGTYVARHKRQGFVGATRVHFVSNGVPLPSVGSASILEAAAETIETGRPA